ncbi:cell division protein ZapA [Pacificimonas flava]|uniref:Cell division protein ZapA n=1 Tax=Pacificimonas flava TaxID=1234595 RepID=M2TC90_9SPHN|nr:cell division protein ZapA [Pacificimonas flava]EMD84254.1 hypothetical protein C725_0184 [Pacificimonas flava]MBB5279870.1 cell division protein ZapA [Pacificimonas flava]
MGQVRVDVGGRSYPLACKDGEEDLIDRLAKTVDAKAQQLQTQLGHLPEVRMLLMSAIMVADDLIRGQADREATAADNPSETASSGAADPDRASEALAALDAAAERVERIIAALEQGGLEPGDAAS